MSWVELFKASDWLVVHWVFHVAVVEGHIGSPQVQECTIVVFTLDFILLRLRKFKVLPCLVVSVVVNPLDRIRRVWLFFDRVAVLTTEGWENLQWSHLVSP